MIDASAATPRAAAVSVCLFVSLVMGGGEKEGLRTTVTVDRAIVTVTGAQPAAPEA